MVKAPNANGQGYSGVVEFAAEALDESVVVRRVVGDDRKDLWVGL